MQLDELLSRFDKVKKQGKGFQARCPAHEDKVASLSITESDAGFLLFCHAGCSYEAILDAAKLTKADTFKNPTNRDPIVPYSDIEAVYPYHDEHGTLLFEVVRFHGKKFRWRKPDGTWSGQGVRRVLYRLPELSDTTRFSDTVFLVEGEKDADRIRSLGKLATTSPGGAGKFADEYAESLRGRRVVVVADRDEPGRKHAADIRQRLEGIAEKVWVVEPKEGKDVSDHLDAGLKLSELQRVGEQQDERVFTARRMAANFLERLSDTGTRKTFYGNPWGIQDIEFAPGGLYVLGGDTGLGKSNFALDLFHYLSEQTAVGYGTNEMSEQELTNRLIVHHGGFNGARELRRPWLLSPDKRAAAVEAARQIAEWKSMIFYDPEAGHEQVGEFVARYGLKFFIFDHLHLTDSATSGDKSAIDREIRGFKHVALKHDIPVLVVSQLRRPNPLNPFAPPTKHDFNGSSAIENASSIAMILYRPQAGAYRLNVVKNRDGDEPQVDLLFDKHTLRFYTGVSSDVPTEGMY